MSVSDYRYGKHAAALAEAESRKTQLFAAAVVAVASISQVFAAPQTDPSQLQSQLFSPIRGAKATSSPVVVVPPQADPTQTAAVLFKPLRGATATSSPVLFGAPQPDPTQIAASVWSSLRAPPASPLGGPSVFIVPPQTDPSQLAAKLFTPLVGAKPKSSLVVFGTPQTDPSQLPAILTPSARPPILGTTVRPIPPIPPQWDITINGSIVWTQLPKVAVIVASPARERTKMGVGT